MSVCMCRCLSVWVHVIMNMCIPGVHTKAVVCYKTPQDFQLSSWEKEKKKKTTHVNVCVHTDVQRATGEVLISTGLCDRLTTFPACTLPLVPANAISLPTSNNKAPSKMVSSHCWLSFWLVSFWFPHTHLSHICLNIKLAAFTQLISPPAPQPLITLVCI